MFDNLKAFIRHGRQAADLKHATVQALGLSDAEILYSNNGVSAIPADLEYADLTSGASHEYDERLESNGSNGQNGEFANDLVGGNGQIGANAGVGGGNKYSGENGYNPTNHKDGTAGNSGAGNSAVPQNGKYDIVANQLVAEEKKHRRSEYPNLDKYQVLERMGEGAFSVVYKARHVQTGQLVAIKILRKYQMDNAQRQAVLKEVIIMRQLHHPKIVKFIEFIESEPFYYIVQELVLGGEVFGAIVNYTYFSEKLARHVIYQVGQAVRYLHEEVGIVHRDIKPENLLFEPIELKPLLNPLSKLRKSDDPKTKKDEGEFTSGLGGGTIGTVKLADFGLSKQIWEHNTKTPCGTVGYTAPEIVRDERYSKEVDMWAIGCVLYTLLCGFPPFYDERIESLTEKVARGEYTFLAPWWDEISADAKYCVSRLLTVDPKRRYTIEEFFEDPWIRVAAHAFEHPVEVRTTRVKPKVRYQNSGMYSPAALALREAFDISAAVHRMGEEAAFQQRAAIPVLEEDEELELPSDSIPRDLGHGFELNLGGASILERRKKTLAVQT